MFVSVAAHADTPCAQDSDCSKGFSCQTVSVGGCAEPVIVCAAGEACDASTVGPVDCNVPEQRACEPGPCTTDADCASGMTCLASSSKSCSSPACADPSQGCSTTVTCTMVTGPSMCVPKYELPCTADADCGDHFTCTPGTTTSCWGSAGSAGGGTGASGAVAPLVAEDAGSAPTTGTPTTGTPTSGCTTMPTGTSSCVPDMINCTTDGDCPATWSCSESLEGVATAGCATGAPFEVDGAVVPIPPCDPVPPVASPSYCVPPSYGSLASSPLGTSTNTGGGSGSNQGGTTATSGTTTSGSSPAKGTAPTTPTAQSNDASTPAEGSGGCGVGGGTSGAAGWLFAAALAFGAGLVRRRRSATAPAVAALSRRR
ncbi:MAG TPA: MYXO-CTERM sorting domain-containing protein [Polyangiaceae bacterium]|nr:MYXO-CTERM sorting domain-containing protein [Polyangiaceae bacterium]